MKAAEAALFALLCLVELFWLSAGVGLMRQGRLGDGLLLFYGGGARGFVLLYGAGLVDLRLPVARRVFIGVAAGLLVVLLVAALTSPVTPAALESRDVVEIR